MKPPKSTNPREALQMPVGSVDSWLLLPDRTCRLEVLGCLLIPASEERIFEPETQDIAALLDWAQDTALCWRADAPVPERVLAMSTCSSAYTDARTVVLAAIWQEG